MKGNDMNEEEKKAPEAEAEPEKKPESAGVSELIGGLKEQGLDDDDIAGTAFVMFADGKMSVGELRAVLNGVDYDLPDELQGLSEEELRNKLNEEIPDLASEGGEPKPEEGGEGLAPAPSIEENGEKHEPEPEAEGEGEGDDEEKKRSAAFDLAGLR